MCKTHIWMKIPKWRYITTKTPGFFKPRYQSKIVTLFYSCSQYLINEYSAGKVLVHNFIAKYTWWNFVYFRFYTSSCLQKALAVYQLLNKIYIEKNSFYSPTWLQKKIWEFWIKIIKENSEFYLRSLVATKVNTNVAYLV